MGAQPSGSNTYYDSQNGNATDVNLSKVNDASAYKGAADGTSLTYFQDRNDISVNQLQFASYTQGGQIKSIVEAAAGVSESESILDPYLTASNAEGSLSEQGLTKNYFLLQDTRNGERYVNLMRSLYNLHNWVALYCVKCEKNS